MSNPMASEGSASNSEGKEITLEQVQAKAAELAEALEAERKSKERILNESKEYKEKYQAYRTKEEEAEARRNAEREERLKKDGQYQVLLEQREARIKELEQGLNNVKSELHSREESILNLRKAAAFEREIGGKLKKDSYWSHVDFDSIAINPDTGEIDRDSLRKVASEFTTEYKELINLSSGANLPNGTASGASGRLTLDQWKALPLKERKKRMKDVKM